MSAPSPLLISELIDQLLPKVPSTSAPLHLLPKLQGPVALLRYWNAHICSEIRRAIRSKSIRWEKVEERDRAILKRMSKRRYEKDLDEKGEAFLLILASWHVQHHLLTNPRAHQQSLKLVNSWFPPLPLPSSYFIGEPTTLDPKTVHATNTKFAKFRTNALSKVQGVRKFVDKTGGSTESLVKDLKKEAEAPTMFSLRFDLRLQWESESAGLLSWAKKIVQSWMLLDRLFPLSPEEAALLERSSHRKESRNLSIYTFDSMPPRTIPDPTILSFSTPDHSVPPRRRDDRSYTDDSISNPLIIHSKSGGSFQSSRYISSSSPSTSSSFTKPRAAAFVAGSQPSESISSSFSVRRMNVADTSLEDIFDVEIISPRITNRIQPGQLPISSSPSRPYTAHTDPRSRKSLYSSRASPPQPPPPPILQQTAAGDRIAVKDARVAGLRRKSGGRPRLSFEPDFDLSIVPPEPKIIVESRMHFGRTVDSPFRGLSASPVRDVQPPIGQDHISPEEPQDVVELISSSPVNKKVQDDDGGGDDDDLSAVADSQEIPNEKPLNETFLNLSPTSPARSLPKKAATGFSFPDLSPRTKRAHRSLLYLPNRHSVYSSSSGSDSDPISDSSDDNSQDDLVGLNHRTIIRAPGTNPIGRIVRQVEVGLKRKRDMVKDESEESEREEDHFWLGGQRKPERSASSEEKREPEDHLQVFTQKRLSASPTTSSSAFDSEFLDSSFSAEGRDSESESAVSSMIADDPTHSSSDEEEGEEDDVAATLAVTEPTDIQDSQKTNSSLGYVDLPLGPAQGTQARLSLSPVL